MQALKARIRAVQAGEFTRNAAATEAVFRGTADDIAPEHQFPSVAALPGGAELSWADFREAVAWVRALCTLAPYPSGMSPASPSTLRHCARALVRFLQKPKHCHTARFKPHKRAGVKHVKAMEC